MPKKIIKTCLLFGDFLALLFSLFFTLLVRYQEFPNSQTWEKHLMLFLAVFAIWILCFYIFNFYNLHYASTSARFYERAIQSIAIASIFSLSFFYLSPDYGISPKTNLLIFIIISTALFLAWRNFCYWLLSSRLPKIKIAIVGINKNSLELLAELKTKPYLGYQAILILDPSQNNLQASNNLLLTHDIKEFENLAVEEKIDQVVLACNPAGLNGLQEALLFLLKKNRQIISLAKFFEKNIGKIPLEEINTAWFWENLNEADKKIFNVVKRFYDLTFALVALTISLPFWPLFALAIKLESQGPVIFKQNRLGQNGKIFRLYKFRTMREENNNRTLTTSSDPRITRFGLIFRKTRIDELPQLINILKGEMSFVGPRPERPELALELAKSIPFYHERELTKPGITGWDQISGEYHSPSVEDTLKKMQYDLFYIKNRSIYLDFSIILKTIATVFSRSGR